MKKLLFIALLSVALTGCVSQDNYDKLQDEYDDLSEKYEALREEQHTLRTDYNTLKYDKDISSIYN